MSDAAEVRSDPNQSWAFAGWGEARKLDDLGSEPVQVKMLGWGHGKHLGQWLATALCGNDITSSCLYVAALSSLAAGIYAPLALILVALILYLFRSIYGEVGAALPLNGGTYTLLLNSTNKKLAAACLTLLSYIATAVIGVGEGMRYARILIPGLNVSWATIGLMFVPAHPPAAGPPPHLQGHRGPGHPAEAGRQGRVRPGAHRAPEPAPPGPQELYVHRHPGGPLPPPPGVPGGRTAHPLREGAHG
nr:amino acid permease [uncultured Holophaga sp.]